MSHQPSITRKLIQQVRRRISPIYYEFIYGLLAPGYVNTMNYGYAPISDDLRDRHPGADQGIQYELYWQTFKQFEPPLAKDQVLCEVSCGRGGGLAFLRNLTKAQIVGLERSPAARRYARRNFDIDARPATAPDLPLENASVDLFISVESAHNYHNDALIAEFRRCLKPEGVLLLADTHMGSDRFVRDSLTSLYARNGLSIDSWRDVRPNVLEALRQDEERKKAFMRYMIGPLRDEARTFMGMVGSDRYREMEQDERAYFILRARK